MSWPSRANFLRLRPGIVPCPQCGAPGTCITGFFSAARAVNSILENHESDIEVLRAVGLELLEGYERGEPPEAIAEKAASIDTALKELLLAVKDDPKLFVQFLIAALALIAAIVECEKFEFHFDNWFNETINNYGPEKAPHTISEVRGKLKTSKVNVQYLWVDEKQRAVYRYRGTGRPRKVAAGPSIAPHLLPPRFPDRQR